MILDIKAVAFPVKTVTILDVDAVIDRVLNEGVVLFEDPDGEAHRKGKAVYVAALRRNLKIVMRYHTKVGNKVMTVELGVPDKLPPTGRGRPPKETA